MTKKDSVKIKKQSQKERLTILQKIITILPGNVFWKNREGYYLGCNLNMAKFFNLNSINDFVGRTLFDLLPKELAEKINNTDESIMSMDKEVSVEEESVEVDGRKVWYLSRKLPLHDFEGNVIGLLGLSFDITERVETEKALKKAKEDAEKADRIKAEFIRNMEHDIRTPFSGVLSLAQMLQAEEQDEAKRACLQDIADSAKELLEYSNSILEFSRIESGAQPVLYKKFNLRSIVDSVINMEKPAVTCKNLMLENMIDDNIPQIVIGDSYRLHRILVNLMSNAIKFTNAGKIQIKLDLAKRLDERRIIVQICVSDTGIGMAEEQLNYIYEKFTRIHATNQGIYKGMGLGLKIVKQFIEDIDGEIEVFSELNKGSMFVCTIPFRLPMVEEGLKNNLSTWIINNEDTNKKNAISGRSSDYSANGKKNI